MEENRINEVVLCVLIKDKDSELIEVGYEKIDNYLESEFKLLESLFKKNYTAHDIVEYIKLHRKLDILFLMYNYCEHLSGAFQGLLSEVETIGKKYHSNFEAIKENDKRDEALKAEKNRLLEECQERLLAVYLEKAYEKCANNKSILTYSHRKVGWSAPKYKLNDNFSIEFKTNFGYGAVSYFYSKIRYKELDIVPFSDWVNYRNSNIFEIVQYSAKHDLTNESWKIAMTFIRDACNLSLTNEDEFVKKYIVADCNALVNGLEKILTDDSFKINESKFLNQEKEYVDLKLVGHNLIEFKGEKISGSLQFITIIKQFNYIVEIDEYVNRIEKYNQNVIPMLTEEISKIRIERVELIKEINNLEPSYDRVKIQETYYEQRMTDLKNELRKKSGSVGSEEIKKNFLTKNPSYEIFLKEFDEVTISYELKVAKKERLSRIFRNLIKYRKAINDYFEEYPLAHGLAR
jgi:hypothetical protein